VRETEALWALKGELGVSLRVAGYVQALRRIGEAVDARGHAEHFAKV
jgi:glutamate dehydrogenase (NADP+)